jgi:hypothetical protein
VLNQAVPKGLDPMALSHPCAGASPLSA